MAAGIIPFDRMKKLVFPVGHFLIQCDWTVHIQVVNHGAMCCFICFKHTSQLGILFYDFFQQIVHLKLQIGGKIAIHMFAWERSQLCGELPYSHLDVRMDGVCASADFQKKFFEFFVQFLPLLAAVFLQVFAVCSENLICNCTFHRLAAVLKGFAQFGSYRTVDEPIRRTLTMQYHMNMGMMVKIVVAGVDVESFRRNVVGFSPDPFLGFQKLLEISPVNLKPVGIGTIQTENKPPLTRLVKSGNHLLRCFQGDITGAGEQRGLCMEISQVI